MFTGIIKEKGKYLRKYQADNKYQLKIAAAKVLKGIEKGDSIAVNGVCLTVVDFGDNYFKADVMPETLKSTNLGELNKGAVLNLEPSLKPESSIGGHFVTGHVDSTAVVKSIKRENNAQLVELEVDQETEKYIVPKGSAAVNGVSLTVMEIENKLLKISLIPESWQETNLSLLRISDKVNIETDMLGKYVFKMLNNLNQNNNKLNSAGSKMTKEFLAENGFMT